MTGDANNRRSKARFSLRIVVPLVLMSFVTVATFWSLYVGRQHIAKNVLREAVRDLKWQATRLQATLERAALATDQEGMQEAISAQAGNPRRTYAALVDHNGAVLLSMRVADVGKTLEESLPDEYANIEAIESRQLRAVRDSLAGDVLVQNDNTVVGVHAVVLGARTEPLRPTSVGNLILIDDILADKAEAFRGVNREALVFFSLLALFTAGLGVFFHLAIARRLRCVMEVAEQATRGEPIVPSGVRGNDEVGYLAGAVDEMIATKARAEKALRESEERIREILNAAVDAIITIDQRGIIQSVNPAVEKMFGYTQEELIGQNIRILMPPPYRDEHDGYIARYLETGKAHIIGLGREAVGTRKDGSKFPIDLAVSEADHIGIFTGIIRDITQRKEAQEALRREHEFAEKTISTAPNIVLVLDTKGRILRFNRYMEDLTGWPLDEVKGKDWFEIFVREDDRTRIRRQFERAIAGKRIRGNINSIVTKDGREREIEWYDAPLTNDETQLVGLLCTGQDITERRILEREMLDIADEEQRRIGHDLHDGLGQELTGLGMAAHALAEMLAAENATKSLADAGLPNVTYIARQLSEGIGRTTAHVRQLSHGLVPVDIDAQGLMSALNELVTLNNEVHDVSCTFEHDRPVELADNFSATHFYRIAQEAINNALKHSQAKHIRVCLTDGDGPIILRVTDDGVGIPDALPHGRGMGLRIMRYRAELIGAELSIEPADGGGTSISCSLGERERERER